MALSSPRKKVAIIGAGAAGMVKPSHPLPITNPNPNPNTKLTTKTHAVLRLHPIAAPRQIRNPPLRLGPPRRWPSDLDPSPAQPRRNLAQRRRPRRLIHIPPHIQLLPTLRIRASTRTTPSILRQRSRQLLHQHVPFPSRGQILRRDRETRPRAEVD